MRLSLLLFLLALSMWPRGASAHGGVSLSQFAYVAPTLDGVIGSVEWVDAAVATLSVSGRTATVYVMNDNQWLYLAVQIFDPSPALTNDILGIIFDNDHDGSGPEVGDDEITLEASTSLLGDLYYDGAGFVPDTADGGSTDGSGAASGSSSNNYFEFRHPLMSADAQHDIGLSVGQSVGFVVTYTDDGVLVGSSHSLVDYGSWPHAVVAAQPFPLVLSAWTSAAPTLDGIVTPGEWAAADTGPITMTRGPAFTGNVRVMNDATNLYILITLSDNELDATDSALVAFDNNHDGNGRGLGDDAIEVTGAGAFFDEFYTGASPPVAVLDTTDAGANDGSGAAGASGGFNVFEIRHPLNSGDVSHDFALASGVPVAFAIRYLDAADGKFAWWPSYHSSAWFEIAVAFPPGQPDFSVALDPATVTVTRGGTATTTLDLASISNFVGQVTLTTGSAPGFLSLTYSQNLVSVTAGGNASSGIFVAAAESAVLSVYPIRITATGGGISHNVYLSVTIMQPGPDFSLALSPSAVSLSKGGQTSTQLSIESIQGFSSAVTISLEWVGTEPSGVMIDAIPPLTPPAGQTASAMVIATASSDATLGDFTLTFLGISGTLSHSTNLTITVTIPPGDFSISLAPEKNVVVGAEGTMTVTVQSSGGFSLPVTLSANGLPSGVAVSFNPNPVTPLSGGAVDSIMLVSASRDATRGTFTLLVIGSDGTRTRNATLILRISACLIATATYGSELSPEVNVLRDFRDTIVLRSYLGSNFMQVFDTWYYSFSPEVAREIDSSEAVRFVFKLGLYPTIMSLAAGKIAAHALGELGAWHEVSVFAAGALAAALLGTSYLTLPIFGASLVSRRVLRGIRFYAKYGILSIIPAVAASLFGLAFRFGLAAQIGTVMSVLVLLLYCPCAAVLFLEWGRGLRRPWRIPREGEVYV